MTWSTSRRRAAVANGWRQQAEAQEVMRRWRRICHVCNKPGADEVDHVIPVGEGGPDAPGNKRPIHSVPCHRDKTAAEAARARARVSRRRPQEPHPGLVR